ncbi:MAG: glycosyl transferase family protein [Betaproteobacteria bacterium]
MSQEHPFAEYVRILGKGRKGAKSLTLEQARTSMQMILAGEALPMQIGAFLMLIRAREETAEETAGFVLAAKSTLDVPADRPQVDLDWASYAGKRRQLPWFLLSALLLARNGVRMFLHNIVAREDGRVYAQHALKALGIANCISLHAAADSLRDTGFASMALDALSPALHELIDLRNVLGLRSPINTVTRMLNPFDAPVTVHGIFHPGYCGIHQGAALLLGQPHMSVFKGEGGEAERNPDSPCLEKIVHAGVASEEEWPARFGSRHLRDESMDVSRLAAFWRGDIADEYAEATVVGTAAIALRALGRASGMAEAETLAADLWRARPADWRPAR